MVLALFCLSIHDQCRVWKQVNWKGSNRIFEKGLVFNPALKAKSLAGGKTATIKESKIIGFAINMTG